MVVFAVGVMTAFESSLASRPRGLGLTSPQFVIVPLTGITFFAIFVALGISFRKRAALHKRFMVLAMLAVLGPPVARLMILAGAAKYFLIIRTAVPAAFVAWCLIADWRRNRIVHPVFAIGGGLLVLSWPLRAMLARSDAWAVVSAWIVRQAAA